MSIRQRLKTIRDNLMASKAPGVAIAALACVMLALGALALGKHTVALTDVLACVGFTGWWLRSNDYFVSTDDRPKTAKRT